MAYTNRSGVLAVYRSILNLYSFIVWEGLHPFRFLFHPCLIVGEVVRTVSSILYTESSAILTEVDILCLFAKSCIPGVNIRINIKQKRHIDLLTC